MAINWQQLAASLSTIQIAEGSAWTESGSSELGRRALSLILGEQEIENAIEWYLAARPGLELVRSVLIVLEDDEAMDRCHHIATADPDIHRRRAAVELLRAFAKRRALPWVRTFLESEDTDIQNWGASLLHQLLLRQIVEPDEAEPYISDAERHTNPYVRRTAETIRSDIDGTLK